MLIKIKFRKGFLNDISRMTHGRSQTADNFRLLTTRSDDILLGSGPGEVGNPSRSGPGRRWATFGMWALNN